MSLINIIKKRRERNIEYRERGEEVEGWKGGGKQRKGKEEQMSRREGKEKGKRGETREGRVG